MHKPLLSEKVVSELVSTFLGRTKELEITAVAVAQHRFFEMVINKNEVQ